MDLDQPEIELAEVAVGTTTDDNPDVATVDLEDTEVPSGRSESCSPPLMSEQERIKLFWSNNPELKRYVENLAMKKMMANVQRAEKEFLRSLGLQSYDSFSELAKDIDELFEGIENNIEELKELINERL